MSTQRYIRQPDHDKRIERDDDYSGDAYIDAITNKLVWAVVGVDPNVVS